MNEEITLTKGQTATFRSIRGEQETGKIISVRENIVTIMTSVNGYNRAVDWHISKLVSVK